MKIVNRTAYATPVVITGAPPVESTGRALSQLSKKELKTVDSNAEIMTLTEVAAYLRASQATVRKMCVAGLLPCRKIFRKYYFSREAILEHFNHSNNNDNDRTFETKERGRVQN